MGASPGTRFTLWLLALLPAAVGPAQRTSLGRLIGPGLPSWASRAPTVARAEPPGPTITVNSLGRWPFAPRDDGEIHIEEAFAYAAGDPGANVITFDRALDGPSGIVFNDQWSGGESLSGNGDSIVGDFGSGDPRVKLAEELYVTGSHCLVRGLCLRWCEVSGDDNKVQACHIGLDLDAVTSWQPGFMYGLNVTGKRNTIGGNLVEHRNHFGKAAGAPVGISGQENVFCTNVVGLQPDLWTPLPVPPQYGVWVGGDHNTIGGIANRFNNIYATDYCMDIGGNTGDDGHHNVIVNNYLGQNNAKAKCQYGIYIEDGASDNVIGGPTDAEHLANIILNCTEAGIWIGSGNRNVIKGTYIGINQWENSIAAGDGKVGIWVGENTIGTVVGSNNPAERTRIVGRSDYAIGVGRGASDVTIRGTWLGFDKNGVVNGGAKASGIVAWETTRLTIGGTATAGANPGNVVAGCRGHAIYLTDCPGPVLLQSNTIGLDCDRTAVLGNTGFGIVAVNCAQVTIGSTVAAAAAAESPQAGKPPSANRGNVIAGCGGGVGLEKCAGAQVQGNLLGWDGPEPWGNKEFGLSVQGGCWGVSIGQAVRNVVAKNENGIGLFESQDVLVANNQIKNSTVGAGVVIGGGVYDADLTGNRISGNAADGVWATSTKDDTSQVAIGLLTDGGANEIIANGGYGIRLSGSKVHDVTVASNWIGVLPGALPAWQAKPNALGGVLLENTRGNRIGGSQTTPNIICANAGPGVALTNRAHHNVVAGNWIGRERPENNVSGNRKAGLLIVGGAHHNTIGEAADNVIAGNVGPGVVLRDAGTSWNVISRANIGTGIISSTPVPDGNAGPGVDIYDGAADNSVGTTTAGCYIASNQGPGVRIRGSGTNRNKMLFNYIGLPAEGAPVVGRSLWSNQGDGVAISAGAQNNVVGGKSYAYRNVISNNQRHGVYIDGASTRLNYVASSYIGTDRDGVAALPNGDCGVVVDNAPDNHIGGGVYKGNVISGNTGHGVLVSGTRAVGTEVTLSSIGTKGTGAAALGNGRAGVRIEGGARQTQVEANVIAANGWCGVEVTDVGTDDARVANNTIGLSRLGTKFLPNGTALDAKTGAQAVTFWDGPAHATVEGNRVYATAAGVHFVRLTFTQPIAELDQGNVVRGNWIGFAASGAGGREYRGVQVENSYAYLADNEIAATDAGLVVVGAGAYAGVRSCTFHDNTVHVWFLGSSSGHLGQYGSATPWKLGGNVLGPWTGKALDACGVKAGSTLLAESNDWGTKVRAQIEAAINCPTNVDFDPLVNGESPTGDLPTGVATIGGLAAQPTAQGVLITYNLPAEASVTATISNLAGRPVRQLVGNRAVPAGGQSLLWDGASSAGTRAPNGLYLVTLTARLADGSQAQGLVTVNLR